jgi:precorrin-2/cobalt-factor-2 C20-methyltransferase
MRPILSGIGVGPGDPELITVKGARLIREADIVFVPTARIGQRSLACAISAPYIDPDQRVVELEYPTDGRSRASLEEYWTRSADTIYVELATAPCGVFLTEGDPMLYSTFIYTMDALRRRHPEIRFEIVPGVSSVNAAAAAMALPLASGSQQLAILPADAPEDVLRSTLNRADTTVIVKMSAGGDFLINLLDDLGLVDQAVWIRHCSQPDQEIVRDVRELRNKRLDYFSLMIVKRRRP